LEKGFDKKEESDKKKISGVTAADVLSFVAACGLAYGICSMLCKLTTSVMSGWQ
jgi:hypothetical protein